MTQINRSKEQYQKEKKKTEIEGSLTDRELLMYSSRYLADTASYDFKTYIKMIKPDYIFEWSYDVVIRELEELLFGDIHRLMIFAPPGWGKSELSSQLLPSFALGFFSKKLIKTDKGVHWTTPYQILAGSYDITLVEKFCRAIKLYISSNIYSVIFPHLKMPRSGAEYDGSRYVNRADSFDLITDINRTARDTKMWFKSVQHDSSSRQYAVAGQYRAVAKGAPTTGFRSHLGILDDMVREPKEVDRLSARDALANWHDTVFSTRMQNFDNIHQKELILMTRWHDDDLPGRILTQTEKLTKDHWWRTIYLPAEAYHMEDKKRHASDHRKEGEVLSHRVSRKMVEEKKIQSSRHFSALYQQKPVPDKGNIIQKQWFKIYKPEQIEHTNFDLVLGGADLSFDASITSSYCVLQKWGVVLDEKQYYLLDQIRGRWTYTQQREKLRDFILYKHSDWTDGFWLEWAATAASLRDEFNPQDRKIKSFEEYENLKKEIPFLQLKRVKDSKRTRLISVQGLIENGYVYIPDQDQFPWVEEYIEEMIKFPATRHNDQVDTTSLCLRLIKERVIQNVSIDILSTY